MLDSPTGGSSKTALPHYHIELPNGLKVTASGPEEHERAMEAVERLAKLSFAPPPTPMPAPAPPPMPAPPASIQAPVASPPLAPSLPPALVHAPTGPALDLLDEGGPAPSKNPSPLLSARIEPYVAYGTQRKLAVSVVGEMKFVLNLFLELAGDKPLNDYHIEDSDLFLAALSKWPKHAQRKTALGHMSAKSIVERAEREGLEPISLCTQQKHVDYMRGFFRWCRDRRHCENELFDGIRLFRHRKEVATQREPFTAEELNTLFAPANQPDLDAPHKLWVPLIALYMGMRINEICQLYVADVVTIREEGHPTFSALSVSGDREGQHIKTPYARRVMPVHPKLIELGFLDYVRDVQASGHVHLFPGLSWADPGPGNQVSGWFNRTHLRQHCGIVSKTKTFHGFRHTFATLADRSGVPEARISQLMGHCTGSSTAQRHYIKPAEVREVKTFMEQIEVPEFEVTKYRKGMFDPYLQHARAKAEKKARGEKEKRGKK